MTTYLTTAQAADRLGITSRRVRALIASGRLPAAKVGRDWIITEADLTAYTPRPPGPVPSAERKQNMSDPTIRAHDRVNNTPELDAHAEIIFYDWPEGDEHLEWVATAPIEEIVDWAEAIEKDEQNA